MKIKNILFLIFLSFYLLSFNNVFALQITKVDNTQTAGGNASSVQFIEFLNDSDTELDITGYKILDSGAPTNGHSISMTDTASNFIIPANSHFIVAIDPTKKLFSNINCKVFKSALKIGATDTISFKKDSVLLSFLVDSVNTYNNTSCGYGGDNSNIPPEQTSSSTTTTKEKIVYVYVPQNNQEKYGDIQVLLPEEKIVPALAEVEYTVKVTDSQKKAITDLDFHWSFGDGGEQSGKDALYTYIYPGEYILIASADGYTGGGKARMNVKVVNPDIIISEIGMGEKENFIILKNNTDYDLFLSNFYLSLDGNFYKLPKNLMIAKNKTLKLSGEAIGFKLPANNISLLYPNKNLLISYKPEEIKIDISLATTSIDEENTIFTENILSKVQTFTPKIVTVKAKENSNQKVTISKDLAKSDIGDKTETVYLKRLVLGNGVSDLIGKTQNKKVDTVYKDKSVDTKLINWVKNLIY